MTTSLSPIPAWFVGAARLVLAVTVVLIMGAMAPHVDAVKSNGKTNVSIRDRVMAQEILFRATSTRGRPANSTVVAAMET